MSDKQKAVFLRLEGWKMHVYSGFWWDPNKYHSNPLNIEDATRIASRRKAARDRARLKTAGFVCYGFEYPTDWQGWGRNTDGFFGTKAEALATLDKRKGAK